MRDLEALRELFLATLESRRFGEEPEGLYEPFHYVLELGGKRLRPVLVLLSCEAFGKNAEAALEAALGIELFHNFSLVHDDVMDNAPLRRARPTVHERWDINTALLSGDALLVQAYSQMMMVPDEVLRPVLEVFGKAAREVCEGQHWDMAFEMRNNVTEDEYIRMIQYKTSVLLGASLEIGALISGADAVGVQQSYNFGLYLGTAFQIKDDLLDVFGDADKFGKQVGGDILANKKTMMLIHALEHAVDEDRKELISWLELNECRPEEKIDAVKAIYERSGAIRYTEQRMESYYRLARKSLDEMKAHGAEVGELDRFAIELYERDH